MQTSIMLPVLAKELKVSASQVQWVAATNMMTWAGRSRITHQLISDTDPKGCFQVIAGRCCDVYGRKRGLYCGMLVWVLSNVASTFMPVNPKPSIGAETPLMPELGRAKRMSRFRGDRSGHHAARDDRYDWGHVTSGKEKGSGLCRHHLW
jgi:hypothetical protein